MNVNRRNALTLTGAVVLAGAIIVGGIYGPTAWKVFSGQAASPEDQVVVQTPPINYSDSTAEKDSASSDTATSQTQQSPATPETAPKASPDSASNSGTDQNSARKYKEPDLSLLNIAPSIEEYFGASGLSDTARTLAYGAAWNIHQYADGYLFGAASGPQMNEGDIKKYIVFHKTLWEKQMENEPNAKQASVFDVYFRNLLNRGIDAFDSKDKVRIEQFHMEIHDLDTHLFRDDMSSKVYGATPFATKRSE